MFVVFLGAPGSGKGTQATILAKKFGLVHVATGELLRDAARRGTELGRMARDYMERGELVPDDLVVAIVIDRLSRPDAVDGAVLDGFPRNLEQARALEQALEQRGLAVDEAIYLRVSDPVLIKRLAGRWECSSCGTPYHLVNNPPKTPGICDRCGEPLTQRPDDRPETVRRRLEVYLEQTAPLLEYYRDKGVLVGVDGEQPIADVTQRVTAAIEALRNELSAT